MAEVTLSVGGYSYKVACRDGEEDHLFRLGELVDSKSKEAQAAVGNAGEVRQLLFASLLFADEALERGAVSAAPSVPTFDGSALDAVAERIEALAEALENKAQSA